jgi:hypothetical protein
MEDSTREAVDERVRWIDAVVADAMRRGAVTIGEAIEDLEDEDLPALLFMLLSARVHDELHLREAIRDELLDDEDPVLH